MEEERKHKEYEREKFNLSEREYIKRHSADSERLKEKYVLNGSDLSYIKRNLININKSFDKV